MTTIVPITPLCASILFSVSSTSAYRTELIERLDKYIIIMIMKSNCIIWQNLLANSRLINGNFKDV